MILLREAELRRRGLRQLADRHLAPRLDLVGVAQLVHREAVLERAHHHDVLLAARRVRRDADELRVLERVAQQAIRTLAALAGAEVVSALDEDRIDRGRRHELADRELVGRDRLERLELVFRQLDEVALRELEALATSRRARPRRAWGRCTAA